MTIKTRHWSKEEEVSSTLKDADSLFTTYNIAISTALLCAGFELLTVDKKNPKRVQFIFKKKRGIESVADQYLSNKLEVKARSFFDQLKALKNKLYSK
ncbi:DUF5659 domain-containing protein [Candidatus Gracilibacteria bacterium]|nr:DUF5659 domain-containing protein [Candidatus Gracilibacteria bacterium]